MIYTVKNSLQTKQNDIISITEQVNKAIINSGVKNGVVVVEVTHSTAGLVRTTERAILTHQDLLNETKRLIPSRVDFLHMESADDAAGHIKSALFGTSVTAIISEGSLVADGKLGYFFIEYDGPRKREYYITILGE